MKTLTISGMHCDACQKLIKMELDDAGFESVVQAFRQVGNNTGEIELKEDLSDEAVSKIVETISNMADYTVKENL